MTEKTKGRTGCHQATSNTSNNNLHFTGFAPHLTEVIVTLTVWGWLPMCLGQWISQRERKHDD